MQGCPAEGVDKGRAVTSMQDPLLNTRLNTLALYPNLGAYSKYALPRAIPIFLPLCALGTRKPPF
jgi:hypothetical protein